MIRLPVLKFTYDTMTTATRSPLRIRALREGFVAEVEGLDLASVLTESEVYVLRRAFTDHPVLVFHGQSLSPTALAAFGGRFGKPTPHTQLKYRVPECPECSFVTNRNPDGSIDEYGQSERAAAFHSDGSFKDVPDTITILHGLEFPSVGGGTDFTDGYAAYDALSEDMKARLAHLRARHRLHRGVSGSPGSSPRPREVEQHPGSIHPVIRTHPASLRKSIYVNPIHTEHIEGITSEDSRKLLEILYLHCTQPRFQYSHKWQRGDVVMWDQRCTLHRAAGGVPRGEARVLLRTMITTGDVPA
jgi:taurine dioxygenase